MKDEEGAIFYGFFLITLINFDTQVLGVQT